VLQATAGLRCSYRADAIAPPRLSTIVRGASRVKTIIWLITVALALLSLGLWDLAERVVQSWRGVLPGEAFPGFSLLVLSWRRSLFLVPLPWIVYAVALSRRQIVNAPTAFKFAGTICIAAVIVSYVVLYGAILPDIEWGPYHRHP
jgi:hypothetical protein